ncbi:MAG TPA: hypothetical protein VLM11_20845 [Streptosporangiaceae bacterium]|nr:hypothetical protein [Streptosporangiaceae bacterium]
MTAPFDGLSADELRALIRDVLRDILPATNGRRAEPPAAANGGPGTSPTGAPAAPPSGVPAGERGDTVQARPSTQPSADSPDAGRRPPAAGQVSPRPVRLETDADLRQFALDILRLADNPARRRDLLAGRLTFTLAGRTHGAVQTNDYRIERGAVTERAVQSASKAGQRIVLGPRAVLTPLARDRALALGVPIEKER